MRVHRTIILSAGLLAAAAVLSACGFAPLHAPQAGINTSAPLRAMTLNIRSNSDDPVAAQRVNYLLRQSLTDRMATDSAVYELDMTSKLTRTALGVTADSIASRYDLSLSVTYVLTASGKDEVLARDTLYAVSTLNAPTDPYARIAAQKNAEERAASDIADKLVFTLARHFNSAQDNET